MIREWAFHSMPHVVREKIKTDRCSNGGLFIEEHYNYDIIMIPIYKIWRTVL
jgi:hypothetical protein